MHRIAALLTGLIATLAVANPPSAAAAAPTFGQPTATLNGEPAPPASLASTGFSVIAEGAKPQVALMAGPVAFIASVRQGEEVVLAVPVQGAAEKISVAAEVALVEGQESEAELSVGGQSVRRTLRANATERIEAAADGGSQPVLIRLRTAGRQGEAAVRWSALRLTMGDQTIAVPLPPPLKAGTCPAPELPALRRPIEQALIEWDWRMQDGIGTERVPGTYLAAIERTLQRGDALLRDLQEAGVPLAEEASQWEALRREWKELSAKAEPSVASNAAEGLWRRVHGLRRRMVLRNPLAPTGPVAFVKQVPSVFSHQLTQYYGACAKPGGGVYALEAPGQSMACRPLAASALPQGSFQHLDVSFDGRRAIFAYCAVPKAPPNRETHLDRFYRLYEVGADGSGLRQLTNGSFDDFAPRYLPNGQIIFISTRRGGFHRCGRGPCPVYTLALANGDGSSPRVISYHETQEWDPSGLSDGRVIYTRWDYVDRDAVHYQQLWTVRPDGTDPRIFYGNNTWNPVGVWEAMAIPGSNRVMAVAAAHHAMTAGSIILLDITKGIDYLDPITRLTPDALFSESEAPVSNGGTGRWHAPKGVRKMPPIPPEATRWPGHCYRSPWPLSERYFLAAYSFDALIGEPHWNPVNMFGLYLGDAFGNTELLSRDPNISSQWPVPLRPRPRPPILPPASAQAGVPRPSSDLGVKGNTLKPELERGTPAYEGTYLLLNVYAADPPLRGGSVRSLRILQVLPKTTPHANDPMVGIPNASPGKQVLGTVPVEADGSAYFRAPAGIPLAFQALDDRGRAIQVMRSASYLQPGEKAACVGCHEPRSTTPAAALASASVPDNRRPITDDLSSSAPFLAMARPPSAIEPGPDGSKPLSYPILVQPVLDKHCVSCHNNEKADGKVILTGEPQGHYTKSYNALAPRVPYSAWGGPTTLEPLAQPDHFGALGSKITRCFEPSHYKVALTAAEFDRIVTWMDANVMFYGTFDPADQARQLRGERIAGPKLE